MKQAIRKRLTRSRASSRFRSISSRVRFCVADGACVACGGLVSIEETGASLVGEASLKPAEPGASVEPLEHRG